MELIFATNNEHKAKEVQSIVPDSIIIITLKEAGINIDIPEPYLTLKENAAEKSKKFNALTGKNCFGEDTGIEVAALLGKPGVHSARYAGENKSSKENIEKLLHNLKRYQDRSAQFKTVVFLMLDNKEYFFEGICKGSISFKPTGKEGFGYDPIFIPNGTNKTFAEMTLQEKNIFSHRKNAIDKLVAFLNQLPLKKQS